MPEIVKAQVGQVGLADQALELRHQHVDVQRLPQLPGEDETTVLPQLPEFQALGVLPRTVFPEGCNA
jgi:hypothetical protein